jgi:hypothetical protein
MRRNDDIMFIAPLLTVVSFLILFVFRAWDDNRLTSWYWVFGQVDSVKVFFALTAGAGFVALLTWLAKWRRFSGRPVHLSPGDSANLHFPAAPPAGRVYPFVIFLASFLCGMLFWNIPEVNIDAARYFTQAKHLELFGVRYFLSEWGREIQAWTDMPLVPFLYGLTFRYVGESRMYIQFLTTVLFALTCVLTYKTGQELWDEETGIYGASFLLCIPYLYTQIPLMLVDVPAMFLLLLSIFALIRALKHGRFWIPLAALSIFFTFFSKYSAWLMLSVLPVIVIVFALRREERARSTCLLRAAMTFSASTVLVGIFAFAEYAIIREQLALLISYQKPALSRWEESFLSTFLFQIHPFLTAFAIVSVYAAFKRKDGKYLIILWLVLLVVLLQIKRIRYIVMIFPLLALMASYGLRSMWRVEPRIIIAASAVMSSVVLALTAYLPFLQKLSMGNLKQAGEFLDAHTSSRIEVHVIQPMAPEGSLRVAVPLMDIFTRKTLVVGDHIMDGQLAEEAGLSPLRFTWEFKTPLYYGDAGSSADIDTVAVISESAGRQLPSLLGARLAGFQLVKSFDDFEGIFRFRTSVRVYEKNRK